MVTDKITAPRRVTITVSNYAHEKPIISLPDNLKPQLQVEFIDLMEQDFLVLERRNVRVYRTYKDEHAGEVQDWATESFSTERWTDWENDIAFELPDLPIIRLEIFPNTRRSFPTLRRISVLRTRLIKDGSHSQDMRNQP